MKTSKIFMLLSGSILLILPVRNSTSCIDFWENDQLHLSPFNQDVVFLPEYYPFFYTYHFAYYGNEITYPEYAHTDETFDEVSPNLNAWLEYFGNKISTDELGLIIYSSSDSDYNAMDDYLTRHMQFVANRFETNTLFQYWCCGKYRPAFDYLYLAKRTEKYSTADAEPWAIPSRPYTDSIASLKNLALRYEKREKDPFLKLRYNFQAMKMAFYSRDYEACNNIFEKNVQNEYNDSLIYYWCMAFNADALYHKKDYAESSYYYAIVFDECPSRRIQAQRNFYIDSEDTWQKSLALCKNPSEKSALWLLTGLTQDNSALPAMKEMLATDPSNKQIELLLAREMEKMQRNLYPERSHGNGDFHQWLRDNYYLIPTFVSINKMIDFINAGLATQKVNDPAFWYTSRAFLELSSANYNGCSASVAQGLAQCDSFSPMHEQLRSISILNAVQQLKNIDVETENRLADDLQWLSELPPGNPYADITHRHDAYRMCMIKLSKLYQQKNEPSKALLCEAQYNYLFTLYSGHLQAEIENLITFSERGTHSSFENLLLKNFEMKRDDLLEIEGTLFMENYQWPEAIATFKRMDNYGANENMQIAIDPFVASVRDCVSCDYKNHKGGYTKLTLAETILAYEKKILNNPADAVTCNLLGNVYYNLSYFGNSAAELNYNICLDCEGIGQQTELGRRKYIYEITDCIKAKNYYLQAAKATNDREFAAKNYFMAAKCEQNGWYMSPEFNEENTNGLKSRYRENFGELYTNYKDTQFYAQAIRECKYFAYYVHHR